MAPSGYPLIQSTAHPSVYGSERITAVHRIDRLTSGVLVLARTKDAARQLQNQMMEGQTTKEYVCRVVGEFPRYVAVAPMNQTLRAGWNTEYVLL